jgi:small-conductance mechanosensitive channel
MILCSDCCFILLSYSGLVFCLLFHSPVLLWSCVLTVVSFSCLTVVLCSVYCFILLSYGGLVFWRLFHSSILRWSCVLTVVSFSCLAVVLCSVRGFILLSYDGLVFWLLFHSPILRWWMKQQSEHKIIVRQENETTVKTQDHRKTGEWNNRQNTRPP